MERATRGMLGTMVLFEERLELAKEVLTLDAEAVE
jgi:hypothetical protein